MRDVVEHAGPVLPRDSDGGGIFDPVRGGPPDLDDPPGVGGHHAYEVLARLDVNLDSLALGDKSDDLVSGDRVAALRIAVHEVVAAAEERDPSRDASRRCEEPVKEAGGLLLAHRLGRGMPELQLYLVEDRLRIHFLPLDLDEKVLEI